MCAVIRQYAGQLSTRMLRGWTRTHCDNCLLMLGMVQLPQLMGLTSSNGSQHPMHKVCCSIISVV